MGAEGSLTQQNDLGIVNTALTRLAQNPINSFGQNSGSGIILQSAYNYSRDALLRLQPWNFARRWVSLAELPSVPVNLDIIPNGSSPGMVALSQAFQLPNECLRVFRFSPKDATWRIVGRAIYTDAIPAQVPGQLLGLQPPNSDGSDNVPSSTSTGAPATVGIEYIRLIEDCMQWDSLFLEAFIWKLCKEMAFGVTGLLAAYEMASTEYTASLANAATANGIENWPDPFWNTDLTDVRYGYVGVTIEGY